MKSAYIHIPFCKTICSYCDFCKMFYNELWADKYLDSLEKEISSLYKGELLDTIYIGGGTPNSLSYNQLEKLFIIISKFNISKEIEYTIECNVELLDEEQVKLFKKYNINRVSIGVQTFNKDSLNFLNRNHTNEMVFNSVKLLRECGIFNINIDLIYALVNTDLDDLKNDIDVIKQLDIPHVSTYSLIIEKHTVLNNLNIKNIDDILDEKMYNYICDSFKDYNHYETSNFAKNGYESRHNLTYWNNNHYYGFGLGASGYTENVRYTNTKNFNNYLKGDYIYEKEELSINETIENEFILGFRKVNGVNIKSFYDKYRLDITKLDVIVKLIKKGKLVNDGVNIYINNNYIYVSNDILVDFLGIDYERWCI